ncbi:dynamin family protein [Paenibacillus sp.]|uniref:dynamin family protein n=1 Tax=Paenibacillus sp. TaxID=58172 RepID=UPI002D2BEE8E|nr:dynamin family protein [Paenibacillus sp.]HZG85593.1 dynamin family protein [Paenibacillus sp.]
MMNGEQLTKERYGSLREESLARFEQIRQLLWEEGMNTNQIQRLSNQLQDNRFQIIVVGEFSSGKSTFINSLLGRALLPSKVKPTTATLGIIQDGAPQATAVYKDGTRKPIPLEEIKTFATALDRAGAEEARKIEHIEIQYPCAFTKDGVVIIDTPGVDELDKQREEVTYNLIPKVDAAILLMDARRPYKYSEKVFLEDRLLANQIGKIFIALNFIDSIIDDGEDPEEIVDYTREKLIESLPAIGRPRLYALSAREALSAKVNGDSNNDYLAQFLSFEGDLMDFLVNEKGILMIRNAVVKALLELKQLYDNIVVKHAGLDTPLQQLLQQEAAFAERLRQFETHRHQLIADVRSGFQSLPSLYEADIRQATAMAVNDIERIDHNRYKSGQFKEEVEAIFHEALRKQLERAVLPRISEQLRDMMEQAQTRSERLMEELERFRYDQLSIDALDSTRLYDLNGVFERDASVGGKQLLMGIGAWFGVPFLVSLFATGGLALIPWAIGMAASIFGIVVWGDRQEKKAIVQKLRQMEPEIAFKIKQSISEKMEDACEQFVAALSGQMNARIENMQAAQKETIENKRKLAGEIDAKKAYYEERLRQSGAVSSKLQAVLKELGRRGVAADYAVT